MTYLFPGSLVSLEVCVCAELKALAASASGAGVEKEDAESRSARSLDLDAERSAPVDANRLAREGANLRGSWRCPRAFARRVPSRAPAMVVVGVLD